MVDHNTGNHYIPMWLKISPMADRGFNNVHDELIQQGYTTHSKKSESMLRISLILDVI